VIGWNKVAGEGNDFAAAGKDLVPAAFPSDRSSSGG
jgi:hypothetical protein